jgi:hypothetical protein
MVFTALPPPPPTPITLIFAPNALKDIASLLAALFPLRTNVTQLIETRKN